MCSVKAISSTPRAAACSTKRSTASTVSSIWPLPPVRRPAQVHVVVDDHALRPEQSLDEVQVGLRRHLDEPAVALDEPHPPARGLHQPGAVGGLVATGERAAQRLGQEGLRRLDGVRAPCGRRSPRPSRPPPRLTVSARGSAGTAPSQPSSTAVTTRSTTSSGRSGRAASWTTSDGRLLGHLGDARRARSRRGSRRP